MADQTDAFRPSSNWTWADLLRTLFDFTATAGALQPQDDFAEPPTDPDDPGTPYQRLERALEENGADIIDLRQHVRTSKQKRGRAHGTRKIENVTAIMWHQMAAAITDARRCLSIPVHGGVLWGSADVVLLHPILAYLYGGHAANRFVIHIELAIRAAGIEGLARTFWRRKSEKDAGENYAALGRELQERQIVSALALGRYYVEEHTRQCAVAREQGRNPRGIVAQMFHRNSHVSRTGDPGSKAAIRVVRALCDEYGHDYGVPVVGSGVPTCTAWDGPPNVRYSGGTKGY